MTIKVQTRSNYRNLNGKLLVVSETTGTRVTCLVFDPETQKPVTVDFKLSEIVEMNYKSE